MPFLIVLWQERFVFLDLHHVEVIEALGVVTSENELMLVERIKIL